MTPLKTPPPSSKTPYRPNSKQVSLWLLAGLYLSCISMPHQYWSGGLQERKMGGSQREALICAKL